MLKVSQDDVGRAIRRSRNTVGKRLRGIPHSTAERKFLYKLTDVLPTVKERWHVPDLFALAHDDGSDLFVGDDAVRRARALERWLDARQTERLFRARVSFTNALAASVQSSVLFEHLEALRLKLVLADPVMRWTVLGDEKALPNFGDGWATAFAVVNARYENLTEKEAA